MLLSTAFAPISKLSTGKCPLIHRTYPQKKGEHPAYPQEKMTRFEQAASLPGKSPSPDFLAYTHERKQKNKTKKQKNKKQNKTKTKRQNNKTKINNKNRKQNKKNDNE